MTSHDVLSHPATTVAPKLLGWRLIHQTPAGLIGGRIVETEAYMGESDPASHAFRGQTARNAVMFGPAGNAYIYFTYGMHYCFNVVTGPTGVASAVLIRALEPETGVDLMMRNRAVSNQQQLTNGPAKLVQALAITMANYGHDLSRPPLWLEPGELNGKIATGPRIGIKAAADRPWRFYINGNPYVSR